MEILLCNSKCSRGDVEKYDFVSEICHGGSDNPRTTTDIHYNGGLVGWLKDFSRSTNESLSFEAGNEYIGCHDKISTEKIHFSCDVFFRIIFWK